MATAWRVYDDGKLAIGSSTNLETGTFKMALLTDAYAPSLEGDLTWTAIKGNEILAVTNGYVVDGNALANIDWQVSTGTAKWDSDAVTWTQNGVSNLGPMRYAVIYDTASDALICYTDFQSDQTVIGGTGATFAVGISTSGILAMSGGTA